MPDTGVMQLDFWHLMRLTQKTSLLTVSPNLYSRVLVHQEGGHQQVIRGGLYTHLEIIIRRKNLITNLTV